MKIPNSVTLAMYRWVESGCKQYEGDDVDMRGTIKSLVSGADADGAKLAMKHAAAIAALHDVAMGGKCGLAVALLDAAISEEIDWGYIVEKFRCTAELN